MLEKRRVILCANQNNCTIRHKSNSHKKKRIFLFNFQFFFKVEYQLRGYTAIYNTQYEYETIHVSHTLEYLYTPQNIVPLLHRPMYKQNENEEKKKLYTQIYIVNIQKISTSFVLLTSHELVVGNSLLYRRDSEMS